MTVDYIYQLVLRLILKNQAGGLSASDFAYHWNAAQSAYQSDLLGRFNRGSNGKSGNNTGLIENETILTKLNPFTNLITLPVASGQVIKPPGFIYTMAMRCNNSPVYSVHKDQLWSLYDDVIDPPSEAYNRYYYTEYLNYYSVFPNTVTSVDLDYIISPTDVYWSYTLDANNRQVYAPGTSVQPQWDDTTCREITERMLKTLGVAFHDREFEQAGQSTQTSGE